MPGMAGQRSGHHEAWRNANTPPPDDPSMAKSRAVAYLTILGGGGALVGVATSVLTAQYFGTSRSLEIFFAASTLQSLAVSLAQTGQLNEILIPLYHRIRESEGTESAQAVYATAINWMLVAVGMICLGLWLMAPWTSRMLVPGFNPTEQRDVAQVFRWLAPLLPLQVLASLLQGILNAERRFGSSEAFSTGIQVLGLASMALLAGKLGTGALIVSLWVNQGFLFLAYLWILRGMKYRHRMVFSHHAIPISSLMGKLGATFGYLACTQAYTFALTAGLSHLSQGTYAVFSYVMRIYARGNGILLGPVATVFFTHFSEAFAKGSGAVAGLVREALDRNLTMGCIVFAAALGCSREAVGALWGGRLFSGTQLDLASYLLVVMAFLLLLSGMGRVLRKLVTAYGALRQLYLYLCVVQVISGLASLVLPRHAGVVGGALVLVLNSALLVVACILLARKKLPGLSLVHSGSDILRWLSSAIAGGGVALALRYVSSGWVPSGRLWMAGMSVATALLASAIALGMAHLLRVPDAIRLASEISRATSKATRMLGGGRMKA